MSQSNRSVGTRVPHRHVVCRSQSVGSKGDKSDRHIFTFCDFVPICADVSQTPGKTSEPPPSPKRHRLVGCQFGTCAKHNGWCLLAGESQSKPQLSKRARIAAYANLKRNAGMALAIRSCRSSDPNRNSRLVLDEIDRSTRRTAPAVEGNRSSRSQFSSAV